MPQQAPTCSLQRHPSACSAGAICCINTNGAPAYPGLSSSAYTCSLVLCALSRQQTLFESSRLPPLLLAARFCKRRPCHTGAQGLLKPANSQLDTAAGDAFRHCCRLGHYHAESQAANPQRVCEMCCLPTPAAGSATLPAAAWGGVAVCYTRRHCCRLRRRRGPGRLAAAAAKRTLRRIWRDMAVGTSCWLCSAAHEGGSRSYVAAGA